MGRVAPHGLSLLGSGGGLFGRDLAIPTDAIRAAFGSLIIAVFAYIAMGISWLEHLIFTFPELLLVILAAVVLIGRYTGYRLLELTRFKALTGE